MKMCVIKGRTTTESNLVHVATFYESDNVSDKSFEEVVQELKGVVEAAYGEGRSGCLQINNHFINILAFCQLEFDVQKSML